MPSDGKSSHCLWQGELKRAINYMQNNLPNYMVTVILKVVEMTLLKYPTWGESFPKTMHMVTKQVNYFACN
jgi:hypothetical protein